MCIGSMALPVTPPEDTLSVAIKADLGVEIDPKALRLFILMRWDRVTVLAHAIHERGK